MGTQDSLGVPAQAPSGSTPSAAIPNAAAHEREHAVGSVIEGRCVTMGLVYTGVVTEVIRTPGEYALRYRIGCSNVARRNPIVFAVRATGTQA